MTNTPEQAEPERPRAIVREVSRALDLAGPGGKWYETDRDDMPAVMGRAQVHATLALVLAVEELTKAVRER